MRSYPAKLCRIFDPDLLEMEIAAGFGEPRRCRIKLTGLDITPADEARGGLLDLIIAYAAAAGDPEDFPLWISSDGDSQHRAGVYYGEVFGRPGVKSLNLELLEYCRAQNIPHFPASGSESGNLEK